MKMMKAVVFKGKDRIAVEEVPRPRPGPGEAIIQNGVLKVALYPGLAPSRPVLEAAGVGTLDEQC